MRPIVQELWLEFTEPIEGGVPSLYNDVRGLTTVAYGNLCNSAGEAAALPFVHPDGTLATTAEIVAAWQRVHDDPNCAMRGWKYAAKLTPLRLTGEGMAQMALRKLASNDMALHNRLPDWETYPACAQMAFHSLAWACGPGAHFPKLFSAAQARDWDACSIHIAINEWTPEGIRNVGLIPRNVANRILMRNAQRVEAYHLDPDVLNWHSLIGVNDAQTLPDLTVLTKESEPPPSPPIVDLTHLYDDIPDSRPTSAASSPTLHVLRYDRGPDDPDDAA